MATEGFILNRPYKRAVPTGRALEILKLCVHHEEIDLELFRVFLGAQVYRTAERSNESRNKRIGYYFCRDGTPPGRVSLETRGFRVVEGHRIRRSIAQRSLKPSMQLLFAKKMNECPQCDSALVRRSTRKGFLEHFLYPLLYVWPYRCNDCDVRFLGFHRQYAPARAAASANRERA
jgi:hypothetical protein